ncbi:MAG: M20 family metallopeptidase [Clostridiaceae bacterium]|nr:M20 family metallopeptidase [Clostridiaceae bacterium]
MTLLESAQALQPRLAELRREFHAHPEVSGQEEQTAARVLKKLEEIGGYEIRTGISGHGILAELKGALPGPMVALRADMDALQITEETNLPYASQNPGVMHACGHDNHITMLLGAAHLLAEYREKLSGSVRLIFQPAEEQSPTGGSRGLMAAGALDGVSEVYGLHVWPDLPLGCFGVKGGALMAASDHFLIRINGESSHGAQPNEGVDALMAGVQLASALQTIVSRNTDPLKSAVITLGRFRAGTRYNIVPGDCEIEGTCRTFDPEVRNLAERRVKEITEGICAAMDCKCEVKYERGYCAVMNDPEKARRVKKTAEALFGPEKAIQVDTPSMCAEDFAFYLTETPGAFAWLGTGESEKTAWPLHNCHFTPNEDILWRGAALLACLALKRDSEE